ncbi:hypothetical protein ACU4GA_16075 [Methylobacterium oryzae CBMB20]
MQLDPTTLLVVSAATTFLVGTLFMASWRQAPRIPGAGLLGRGASRGRGRIGRPRAAQPDP